MKLKSMIKIMSLVIFSLVITGCPKPYIAPSVENKRVKVKPVEKPVEIPFTFPVAPLTKPGKILLDYISFSGDPKVAALGKFEINVSPNSAGTLDVKLTAKSSDQSAEWKTAIWVAALNSAFAVGRDLTEYSIAVKGSGVLNGPGSGALFSAGIMAAMTGHKVKNDVLLLGSVNPDGTIGPISDIPDYIRAAAKNNKKSVGYPAGQKMTMDSASNTKIDIEKLAETLGVKTQALNNIYDGFELLTGKEFPRPPSVSKEKMVLGTHVQKSLSAKAAIWKARYKEYSGKFKKARLKKYLKANKRLKIANKYLKRADELTKNSKFSPMYDYSQRGGSFAFSSYSYGMFQKKIGKSTKVTRHAKYLQKSMEKPLFTKLALGVEDMSKNEATNAPQFLTLISSYQQLIAALVYGTEGSENIVESMDVFSKVKEITLKMGRKPDRKRIKELKKESLSILNRAVTRFNIADSKELKARDFISFKNKGKSAPLYTLKRVQLVTEILEKVGMANLDYINFVIKRRAGVLKKEVNSVKQQFFRSSNNYLLAFNSVGVARKFFAKVSNKKALKYYKMAGALSSFINSLVFMAKEYSLGVEKRGAMKSVKNEEALDKMLINAEEQARVYANLALMTSGAIPVMSKFYYGIAQTSRGENTFLKIKAIELFWRSTMESRLAILLSR